MQRCNTASGTISSNITTSSGIPGGRRRLRREDTPEVYMGELLDHFQRPVELRKPALHQMDVRQHDPAARLRLLAQARERNLLLPLAHGDVDEAAVCVRDAETPGATLHGRRRVRAREEHEEQRRQVGGFLVRDLDVEGVLLDVVLPQAVLHELRQRGADPVRAEHAKEHEAVQWRNVAEGARQVRDLRLLLREPALPAQGVLLQVLRQCARRGLESRDRFQRLQHRPLLLRDPSLAVLGDRGRSRVRRAEIHRVDLPAVERLAADEDAEREHGGDDELVRVEEAAGHVPPDVHGQRSAEVLNALLQVLARELDNLLLLLFLLLHFFLLLAVLIFIALLRILVRLLFHDL